jgi:ArsR family transcriptional regulator, virulence genes transcriptional regulator
MNQSQSQTSAQKINHNDLRKAALVLRAVNHKLRQKMMDLIDQKDRVTVTEIFNTMQLEQSVASQHLAILRKAGVVDTEREGKFIFYSINSERLSNIMNLAGQLAEMDA